jgi:hypothetical protein
MKNETDRAAPGLGGDFLGREKQGATHASRGWPWMATLGLRAAGTAQRNVFLAASRDGSTAARKIPSQSRRRSMKKLSFTNIAG